MRLCGSGLRELTQMAKKEGWAIGAFNAHDIDSACVILDAAEETHTPVMIQLCDYCDPNLGFLYMSKDKLAAFYQYILYRADHNDIPVAIHLDHCQTIEGCARAIQFGATSVMLDASMKPFEENVALTNAVKKITDATNVLLEAEIGHVTGHIGSSGNIYTDTETAVAFEKATGVDLLAVSIGTVHGEYKEQPKLNYDRIREINAAVPAALCMHGSSGLGEEEFTKAIEAGIVKINFSTYLHKVLAQGMKEAIDQGKKAGYAINNYAHDLGVEYIKKHIGIFRTKSF